MTALTLALSVVQAGFLLWAAVQAGRMFLQWEKVAQLAQVAATLAVPLAIAWFGRDIDPHRTICGIGDCLVLTLSVGFVKYWADTREAERLALEREIARRIAAEKAAKARQAEENERLKTAAANLAAKQAPVEKPEAEEPRPARHLTPSLLPGGARPRFPAPRNPNFPRK